jgi:hypothetical protein
MSTNCLNKPKFFPNQTVSFIGGIGKIKNIQRQDTRWTYTVEMGMGKTPHFGRVGAETTIVLEEQDIKLLA